MYGFRINDEPFAAGFINSGSDDIYVSTGAGYIEAAKNVSISFDPETGFPSFGTGGMACFPTFSTGQTPNIGLLEYKAAKSPESADDYRLICERMKEYDVGARLWGSFTGNEADIILSSTGWGGTWGGHAVPDLIDFARIGTSGFREKIARYKDIDPDKRRSSAI